MLWGVGEPQLRRRAPALACLGGGRTGRAADASTGEAWGAALTAIATPTRAAAASRGVAARLAMEVAPTRATTLVSAKATTPAGAMATAAAGATLADSVAAATVSAAKVFLLRLPGGRPHL
jgi:hypothetical protein